MLENTFITVAVMVGNGFIGVSVISWMVAIANKPQHTMVTYSCYLSSSFVKLMSKVRVSQKHKTAAAAADAKSKSNLPPLTV